MNKKTKLPQERVDELFQILKKRFEKNSHRHPNVKWEQVQTKLESHPDKLWSLNEMEETGGEPDVIVWDQATDKYTFYDCSPESPKGRRSLCYDQEALVSRKKHPPKNSALSLADEMGVSLLTEEQYLELQQLGEFDTKTSNWLKTPADVRSHGGAIFGDRRFGRVFIYHNGADSYYGARGFRGLLKV